MFSVDPAAALSGAIIAFRANLKERRAQIDRTCETFRMSLKKDIRYISNHLYASTIRLICSRRIQLRACNDDDGHYFTEVMKDIYAAAIAAPKIRGRRLHDARSESLLRAVTMQDGPYRKISHSIQEAYEAMFKTTVEKLWTNLNDVFERTRHDVTQVCSTKEDDSPEAKKMREELLAMLPEARKCLENDIWKELAKCKQGRSSTKIED